MDLKEIFNGILSSVLYSIIVFIAMFILAKITKVFDKIQLIITAKKSGITNIYINQISAEKDMKNDFKSCTSIKVMCTRASSILQPDQEFSYLLNDRTKSLKFLLPNPESDFVTKRGQELQKVDDGYKSDIIQSLRILKNKSAGYDNIKFKLYNECSVVFRIWILDEIIYIAFFLPITPARKNTIIRLNSSSPLYKPFCKYFDDVWNKSNNVS